MRGRIFWPVMLILAGVLFLLDNLGWLPGNAWNWIVAVALIAGGVSLLWPRRSGSAGETTADSAALEGATEARVTLRHGAGRLVVRGGAAPGLLFSGSFGGGLDKQARREGEALLAILSVPTRDWTQWMWPHAWRTGGWDWRINLSAEVPLKLMCELGASETELNLADLRVTELTLKTGASMTSITAPARAGYTRLLLESGAAAVHVNVPAGVAARIRGTVGMGALNVNPARFPRRADEYASDDFATAENRVEIEVQAGMGRVEIS